MEERSTQLSLHPSFVVVVICLAVDDKDFVLAFILDAVALEFVLFLHFRASSLAKKACYASDQ